MNKISRKGFIEIAAAAAMSGVTAGALAACNAASGSASASTSGAAGLYTPGTYEGTAEGISSTVKVTMTFSDSAVTDVVVDTDILIVGAGNGGMFAAAYAAANGLNFRVIEQNANVQDTRHWYGAVDSAAAKEAGEPATDKAKLLSEISRYASGKCDQRVVKTWINESAAMHDFMRSILEDKYGWVCDFTSGSEAAWPAENAEHNTDYLYPVQEHNYMASESASGLPRNELLLQYIQELGYDVDFKTSLAKLEKNSDGCITGIIAQSTEDDHFIRYNANQGVLLACGGFPGNPYMMEQLDPLGTSVTTACSYSPADKGYGNPRCCMGRC